MDTTTLAIEGEVIAQLAGRLDTARQAAEAAEAALVRAEAQLDAAREAFALHDDRQHRGAVDTAKREVGRATEALEVARAAVRALDRRLADERDARDGARRAEASAAAAVLRQAGNALDREFTTALDEIAGTLADFDQRYREWISAASSIQAQGVSAGVKYPPSHWSEAAWLDAAIRRLRFRYAPPGA